MRHPSRRLSGCVTRDLMPALVVDAWTGAEWSSGSVPRRL
jgi:hypothetical protein